MDWYLKKNDEIYGPIHIEDLKDWAADGRIAPDDQVSQDRQAWKNAPQVPALEMNWNILLDKGETYGPVHLLALRHILEEGTAELSSKITNTKIRKTMELGPALISQIAKQNDDLRSRLVDSAQHLEQMQLQLQEFKNLFKGGVGEAKKQIEELETLKKAPEPVRAEKVDTPQPSKQILEDNEALKKKIQTLEENILEKDQAAQDKVKQLGEKLNKAEKDLKALEESKPAEPSSVSSKSSKEPFDAYQDLSRNYDVLIAQSKQKSEEIQTLLNTREELETGFKEHIHRLDELLQGEKEESNRLRRQLAELEESHFEVLRSYREMNDRIINLRSSRNREDESGTATDSDKSGNAEGGWKPKVRLTKS